ncbi:MAG: HD domain-containing protein, partial [Chloroflexi bacterium]|nr:HD domain-containing protein [Chloroflexota bacterium]
MTNLTKERLKIYVPEEAASLLEKLGEFLQQRNIDCYVVGGFVRDGLMGRTNSDIDLAVAGDAIEIASEVAKAFDARMVPLDEVNQVARVVFPQAGYQWHLDFATIRGSIEQDLTLRDFTVNAIAIRLPEVKGSWAQAEVIDPLYGCRDLSQRVIRAVSDASFRQDPARLLRAVRLAATLDFSIDPATEALIQRDSRLVTTVAGERLRDELCYILETHKAYQSFCYLDRLDLLAPLMPELTSSKGVTQPKEHFWDVFDHSLETVACIERLLREKDNNKEDGLIALVPWSPEIARHFTQEVSGGRTRRALLKLAALLHDIGKPATKTIEQSGRMRFLGHAKEGAGMAVQIMERLRFSNREIKMVQLMIEHHLRPGYLLSEDGPSRRAIYKYFRDTADVGIDTLFLGLADHLAARGPTLDPDQWRKHTEVTQY